MLNLYWVFFCEDLDEAIRKDDLERTFMKYGPLKEIWLASYAPYYAFVVFRDRMDAQVGGIGLTVALPLLLRMLVRVQMVPGWMERE